MYPATCKNQIRLIMELERLSIDAFYARKSGYWKSHSMLDFTSFCTIGKSTSNSRRIMS